MMILAISRRLPQLLELQRERTWQPLEGREMADMTVGVVGLGLDRPARCRAALRPSAIAQRQSAVSLVRRVARPNCPMCWAERLRRSGATTDRWTQRRCSTPSCCRVKPGSWLINVARGAAGRRARAGARRCSDGPLGGAVLDAFREEPLPANSASTAAQHHRHAAHLVVERPGARPQHRAVLRQPGPLHARRGTAQPGRSARLGY